MIIERTKDEVLIRIDGKMKLENLQSIVDYIRYLELTSKSRATQKDVDALVKKIKKGRWERTKKQLGIND
jgi:hypothetical protein